MNDTKKAVWVFHAAAVAIKLKIQVRKLSVVSLWLKHFAAFSSEPP